MRKLREVLRLRFELKLGYQQIGRSCAIGVSAVHKYLKRAKAAGVTWPLPADWDEARIEAMVFPRREATVAEHNPARTSPDFAARHFRGPKPSCRTPLPGACKNYRERPTRILGPSSDTDGLV